MDRLSMEEIVSDFYDFVDCECKGPAQDKPMDAELEELSALAADEGYTWGLRGIP